MPITATTTLPNVDDLSLDASVEDQFTADWPDVSNNGEYDIEYREADEGDDFANRETVDQDTSDLVIEDLEDGEKYDVRVRSRTEYVTGDWYEATEVTLMPTIDDFAWSNPTTSSLDADWTDPADNEDGIRLFTERERNNNPQVDDGFEDPVEQYDLDPNTESKTVDGLDQNREYRGYVEIYTEHVFTTSNTDTATTDVSIVSRGWQTVMTHPDGEKWSIRPDDIISVDLNREHTAMSDYAFTVPYSGDGFEYWVNAATEVDHYYSGEQIFHGYLEREQGDERRGEHTIEGRGILRDLTDIPIDERFESVETYEAIEDVLEQTDFDFTVEPPDSSDSVEDEEVQESVEDAFEPADDEPIEINDDGELERLPSSFFAEGEDADDFQDRQFIEDEDNVSGRTAYGVADDGDYLEYEFTVGYDIPEDSVGFEVRDFDGGDDVPEVEWTINGDVVDFLDDGVGLTKSWSSIGDGDFNGDGYQGGDLSAGDTVTARVECTGSSDNAQVYYVDCLALHDKRYDHTFTDDTDSDDTLANPAPYAPGDFETVLTDVTANATAVEIDSTWNDTDGNALFVSNTGGASYEPDGGATDTATLDQDMDSVGTELRAKVTMGGYGSQSESPTEKPNGHVIEDWSLLYDGDNRSVIDDSRYTGSAMDVLQKLHRKAGRRFVTPMDGSKTLDSFPTGSKTRDADWTAKNRRPTRDLYDYANRVTVYGALQDDGTRPTATAEDADEIDANGAVRHVVVVKTDLDGLDPVKSEARSQVSQRVDEKRVKGRVEIWPTGIDPGYSYPVDWYGDGDTVDTPLERLSVQERYSDDSAELRFERDRGNDPEIVEARFERSTLEESL